MSTQPRRSARVPDVRNALLAPGGRSYYRTLPARLLAVPLECWLEGEDLHWKTPAPTGEATRAGDAEALRRRVGVPRFRKPTEGMFEGFLKLSDAPGEKILDFVRRWGPLGICEHGLPHTHWPLNKWDGHAAAYVSSESNIQGTGREQRLDGLIPCFALVPIQVAARIARGRKPGDFADPGDLVLTRTFCQPCGTVEQNGRGGHEPLAAWRRLSREADAIVQLASLLHTHEGAVEVPGWLADLVQFGGCDEKDASARYVDWRWLQSGVERWIGYGNVRPSLMLDESGPAVCLGSANGLISENLYINGPRTGFFFASECGLFGAIASQLLLACQNRGGVAICAECQAYFEPSRKPRAGERSFCSDACRRKRSKHAARDLRKRKKLSAPTVSGTAP